VVPIRDMDPVLHVIPAINDTLPRTFKPEAASVIAVVRPPVSSAPTNQAASTVTVPAEPVFVKVAVSWARGKFAKAGDPPAVVAQPVEDQFCVPDKFQ
jgi:hypothetical protein